MKAFKEGFAFGLMFGLLVALTIHIFFFDIPLSTGRACITAAAAGTELVWQEKIPYCHVPVEMNGDVVLMELSDYEKYQENR